MAASVLKPIEYMVRICISKKKDQTQQNNEYGSGLIDQEHKTN